MEPAWNPAAEAQAVGRISRLGTTHQVTCRTRAERTRARKHEFKHTHLHPRLLCYLQSRTLNSPGWHTTTTIHQQQVRIVRYILRGTVEDRMVAVQQSKKTTEDQVFALLNSGVGGGASAGGERSTLSGNRGCLLYTSDAADE